MKARFHRPRRARGHRRQVKAAVHRIAHVLQPGQGFLFELVFGHAAFFKNGDVYRKCNVLNMLAVSTLIFAKAFSLQRKKICNCADSRRVGTAHVTPVCGHLGTGTWAVPTLRITKT